MKTLACWVIAMLFALAYAGCCIALVTYWELRYFVLQLLVAIVRAFAVAARREMIY